VARLRDAGIQVEVGLGEKEVVRSLRPYLAHRQRGTPWVVLKLAATLDGRIAAPDGSSQWITGPEARIDAQHLRAESDAIVVGAGTVRADNPALTVRDVAGRNPLRVVLGHAPEEARVHPALVHVGDLQPLLEDLGRRGVLQLLVEGGSKVAASFHRAGMVDQYVIYLAPALLGGEDGVPLFSGPGAASIADAWRGKITEIRRIGPDVRIDLVAATSDSAVP
jgi:diaminohydroxyphosphoribosylaminopyrimidine deaminase/5-amino-6-(5-phosphoribosylamino)uracil reductase